MHFADLISRLDAIGSEVGTLQSEDMSSVNFLKNAVLKKLAHEKGDPRICHSVSQRQVPGNLTGSIVQEDQGGALVRPERIPLMRQRGIHLSMYITL